MGLIKKVAKTVYKKTVGAGNPSLAKVAKTAYRANPIRGIVQTTKALRKSNTQRRK